MTTTATYPADLEPAFVSERTYVTRRRAPHIDAAALLSLMICLITLVPSNLIFPGMTDLGRPGLVVGFAMFCWCLLVRFTPYLAMSGPQPMRWAVLAFLVAALLSYAVGFLRGLTTMEANGADRMVLFFCLFTGVVLTAADGIPNWYRLWGVLQVLVWCGAIVAAIAIVEFLFAFDVRPYLTLPGLQPKGLPPGFETRGSGIRVASTTTHYIELAAVLAMVLPFAIHFAFFSRQRWRRRVALVATLLIAAGVAATISRTGILAMALMVLVLIPLWTWRMRYNAAAMSMGLIAALAVANPGLVRTLSRLFENPASNPAFTVRADRYPLVFYYVAQRPWLGRGTGTWIAPQYQILDNQWLATLISNGVVGVATLAGLHLTGIALSWIALRRCASGEDRHLCAVLISTQVIAVAVAGTFDSLSFSTYAMVLAVTLGLCGTVWRLTHPARRVRTSTTRWFLDRVSETRQPAARSSAAVGE